MIALRKVAKAGVLWLGLLLVLYLAGCRVVYVPRSETPVRVFRAEKLEPEGWYKDVFERMEKCSHKDGEYLAIEWYVVGATKMGEWVGLFSPPNRIYLDERHVMNADVVGHEELHYLTGMGDDDDFAAVREACGITTS